MTSYGSFDSEKPAILSLVTASLPSAYWVLYIISGPGLINWSWMHEAIRPKYMTYMQLTMDWFSYGLPAQTAEFASSIWPVLLSFPTFGLLFFGFWLFYKLSPKPPAASHRGG